MKRKTRCSICGFRFIPKPKDLYLVDTSQSSLMLHPHVMSDAVDCPCCGVQVILCPRYKIQEDKS